MAAERQTKQKAIIYEALKTLDHPTATEVYGYVHERYPSVSRATVFRVLSGFSSSGRALEVRLAGSDMRYDYNVNEHYHVHCRCCGKIADVEVTIKTPATKTVSESCGYLIDGFAAEFFGICPACAENKSCC
ncbi:MAG: transcriptional repressor [Clostridia bacterium]|nr:transcriptional repressor [Clostridia bacterium]